jgi:hypothetical protein
VEGAGWKVDVEGRLKPHGGQGKDGSVGVRLRVKGEGGHVEGVDNHACILSSIRNTL